MLALICQRVLCPESKLATARALGQSTLASELGVDGADQDDLYGAMDWLLDRQERIEERLARRHLKDGELVLYDVSSSYFEGRACPLAQLGYSRDGKRGAPQIIYGLLCDRHGRPVSVEVFEGSWHDDKTLPSQIQKLTGRFRLKKIVVAIDRGMVTKANIETLKAEGIDWITALKAPQVKKLVKNGDLQLALFDQQNLAEIASEDYPGERLVVCRNPLVGTDRTRRRQQLLEATESDLQAITQRVKAGTLQGKAEIALEVGPALKRHRVKKHFQIQISDDSFTYRRKTEQIEAEAALDGFYVLRTSVTEQTLPAPEVVRSYKQLKEAERAFKTIKGPTSRSARSPTASTSASKRTRSSACSPTTSPGTSNRPGPNCSSKTNTRPSNPTPSPKPPARPPPSAKPAPSAPATASLRTRCPPCSRSSRPRPATPSASTPPTPPSSNSPPPPTLKPALTS